MKVAARSNPANKGFYWTGDILSTALGLEYGQEGTCGIRIFADLTGLFSVTLRNFSKLTLAPLFLQGVLLFLVLVCNRQVLSTLCRNRCRYRYISAVYINSFVKCLRECLQIAFHKLLAHSIYKPLQLAPIRQRYGASRIGGDSS